MFAALLASNVTLDLIFDLDDTLVSMGNSLSISMCATISHYSKESCNDTLLATERPKEPDRDHVVFMYRYLNNKGIKVTDKEVREMFAQKYLEVAKNEEGLLVDIDTLKELGKRNNIFILTDRERRFYDPIWKDSFKDHLKGIVCFGDLAVNARKPDPANLNQLIKDYKIQRPVYIGNDEKDMQLTKNASIIGIGVTTNRTEKELRDAGAAYIISSVNELPALLKTSQAQKQFEGLTASI